MQQNGMSKSVQALALALQGVLTEVVNDAVNPAIEMVGEVEQRLTARIEGVEQSLNQRIDGVEQRIDTTNENVQAQLVAQHKETIDQVRRITRKGY